MSLCLNWVLTSIWSTPALIRRVAYVLPSNDEPDEPTDNENQDEPDDNSGNEDDTESKEVNEEDVIEEIQIQDESNNIIKA